MRNKPLSKKNIGIVQNTLHRDTSHLPVLRNNTLSYISAAEWFPLHVRNIVYRFHDTHKTIQHGG